MNLKPVNTNGHKLISGKKGNFRIQVSLKHITRGASKKSQEDTSGSPAFLNISVCISFNFERNYATTFIHQDNTKKNPTVSELFEVLNSLR